MVRENFTPATRRLIAERAGHQCSFPTCNRRTIGPGASSKEVSGSGKAAHIYSASPKGPRGQWGLSADELIQPENGIWLCSDHATLIDNNRGENFSPQTLLSYKDLQEARVALEVQGLYSPISWLHELKILKSPLFAENQTIRFAKLNLLYGNNGTGKTALTKWLCGFFDSISLKHWRGNTCDPIQLELSFLNPKLQHFSMSLDQKILKYTVDGQNVAFIPIGIRIIRIGRIYYSEHEDDLSTISRILNFPPEIVLNLVDEIHAFAYSKVSNLLFKEDKEGYITLYCDVEGTVPGLSLRSLSGGETERLFLEFATAAARLSGRYCPTLLILDGCPSIIFKGLFDFYSHHFLDPENQFQTIMCIPTRDLDLNSLKWKGWEVIRTTEKVPSLVVTQEIRVI